MNLANAFNLMAEIKHVLDNVSVTITTMTESERGPFADNDQPVTIVKDKPAKISKGTLSASKQLEYLPDEYDAVLIIDNGIAIPAGCTVTATSNVDSSVTEYKQASRAYVFASHQEVALQLIDKS